jgi:hypothetical protein
MNVNFPIPPGDISQSFFIQFMSILRTAFLSVVSKDESTPRILLSSPSGKVYSITVSDTGTITATLNDGKSRL